MWKFLLGWCRVVCEWRFFQQNMIENYDCRSPFIFSAVFYSVFFLLTCQRITANFSILNSFVCFIFNVFRYFLEIGFEFSMNSHKTEIVSSLSLEHWLKCVLECVCVCAMLSFLFVGNWGMSCVLMNFYFFPVESWVCASNRNNESVMMWNEFFNSFKKSFVIFLTIFFFRWQEISKVPEEIRGCSSFFFFCKRGLIYYDTL